MAKLKIKKRYLYIALILAICTSMTALVSVNTDKKEIPKTKEVNQVEKVVETEKKTLVEEQPSSPKPEKEPEKFEPVMPLKGEIIKDYHIDTLVYSNTLKDYRTHPGIDIKGKILDKVCAIEKGVVENAYDDALMGNTIIISHQNGIKSIYSNLSTLEMVSFGQSVTKGMVISGIGDTALLETGDEAHLHFEMTKNGESINPLTVIK